VSPRYMGEFPAEKSSSGLGTPAQERGKRGRLEKMSLNLRVFRLGEREGKPLGTRKKGRKEKNAL